VAFDLLRREGEDLRLRPIEARREALMRLLAVKVRESGRLVAGSKAIVFSEALAAEGAVVFAKACEARPRRHRVETSRELLQERKKPQLAQNQEPGLCQDVTAMLSRQRDHSVRLAQADARHRLRAVRTASRPRRLTRESLGKIGLTHVLFSGVDRRKHRTSAARPTGRTPGLHSRPPRLISAAWKCSHAQATCEQ
jgi:hypothetical protein